MRQKLTQSITIIVFIFAMIACKNNKKSEEKTTNPSTSKVVIDGIKEVDLTKSTIQWKGHKLVGSHTGTIQLTSGKFIFDEGNLKGGSFVADMHTIKATELMDDGKEEEEEEDEGGHDDRDDLANHLKAADFFDAQTYPKATLTITSVSPQAKGGYMITGNMTIKGQTHPVSFSGSVTDHHFTANVAINRTKFGIKYGSGSFFSNLGDNIIKDEFTLIVSLFLVH